MKNTFDNKKELVIILCVVIGVIGVIAISLLFMKHTPEPKNEETTTTTSFFSSSTIDNTETIAVIPTMQDTLLTDSAWTPTFQLIWNDLKNKYVHQDIKWEGQPIIVDSLNKEIFKEDMISDAYLYKVSDYKTLELKKRIEKAVKDKFNQESEILNDIDWSDPALDHGPESNPRRILLYSMLYREFEYINPLDELQNAKFKDVEDVRYFGFDDKSDSKLADQIDVLYYDKENYMIRINTKNNDELYLIINPEGSTFEDVWTNANNKAKEYTGNKEFTRYDYLKIPYLSFNVKHEYNELCGHDFLSADGNDVFNIQKAIQTIKLELDNKGGKVKSEAVIDVKDTITSVRDEPEHRYFYYNDTFALFIKEKDKEVPYFAARVDDINKYQSEA